MLLSLPPLLFSKLDIETDTTSWAPPVMTNCKPVRTISDIDNITVTTGKETYTHTFKFTYVMTTWC